MIERNCAVTFCGTAKWVSDMSEDLNGVDAMRRLTKDKCTNIQQLLESERFEEEGSFSCGSSVPLHKC